MASGPILVNGLPQVFLKAVFWDGRKKKQDGNDIVVWLMSPSLSVLQESEVKHYIADLLKEHKEYFLFILSSLYLKEQFTFVYFYSPSGCFKSV